ncbi:MFS general substrate transporter [Cyathus striatus]|nr:MFS general substrate transporter [Cyathus striatus]
MNSENSPLSSKEKVKDTVVVQRVQVDGGFQAWGTLIGGAFVTAATLGYSNAFGVYQDVYTRSGLASASKISWIGSTQIFFMFSMGLPAGKLLDIGYYRHTMILGTILYVFSLFMVSLAHRDKYYQVFLAQAIGMGIGSGLLYVPAIAIQNHYWKKRRTLALGIAVLGSSAGGLFFPIMLNQLFNGSAGFEWGVRASAFLCLFLLGISVILMKPNPDALSMDKPKPDFKGILTDVPYMITNLGALFCQMGVFFPYFYLQLFAILHGVESKAAFYTLAAMNAASFPGRVLPNLLADRLGPLNSLTMSGIICAALIFALFGVKSVASTMVFAVIYGFFSGAWFSLAGPTIAGFSRHPSEAGVRFGIAFGIASFGTLIGNPIIGALLGSTFPWFKAIAFSGAAILFGCFLFLVSRFMLVRRKETPFI